MYLDGFDKFSKYSLTLVKKEKEKEKIKKKKKKKNIFGDFSGIQFSAKNLMI